MYLLIGVIIMLGGVGIAYGGLVYLRANDKLIGVAAILVGLLLALGGKNIASYVPSF